VVFHIAFLCGESGVWDIAAVGSEGGYNVAFAFFFKGGGAWLEFN